MKEFNPILNDLPISYALEHKEYFVNTARSKAWGGNVFFFPSTYSLEQIGCSLYGYYYGEPFVNDTNALWNSKDKYGNTPHYNNCVGCMGAFYHMRTGIILEALIGDAINVYKKYKGRKDGGNFNGQYIGDTIKAGDMLVLADLDKNGQPTLNGAGHILSLETTDCNVMEGAYSRNKVYKDKACITYKLNKSDMHTGKIITLRPQSPYKMAVYGIIHTGDVFDDIEMPTPVDKDNSKNQLYISDIVLNVRTGASTSSAKVGTLNKPNAYFDVLDVSKQSDYTWYKLTNELWVAGVEETTYYPKQVQEDNMKKINSLAKEIVELSK